MSQDEIAALADCVGILLDDIRQSKARSVVILADNTDRAGDSEQQQKAAPADSASVPHE